MIIIIVTIIKKNSGKLSHTSKKSGKELKLISKCFGNFYFPNSSKCNHRKGLLRENFIWGRMDTGICMAEFLHRSPETITTLLTGYTPIQNKKFKT